MERLSRVASYFRRTKDVSSNGNDEDEIDDETIDLDAARPTTKTTTTSSTTLPRALESFLLWENPVDSILLIIVFHLFFWGVIVFEVRCFAAASSAALVVLCCCFLEAPQKEERTTETTISHMRTKQVEKVKAHIRSTVESLKQLRRDQPGTFCAAVCSVSLVIWIIGRTINGVLLAYVICMSILLGPALLLKLPGKMTPRKEWDSEIEEFLPVVNEDNLQVLQRAGESGDHSPTPTSGLSDAQNEFFNDDELNELRMPSHEDGSTDGVELSELEFSTGETDVDGIAFQSGHFEKGSSSEEEAELEPESKKMTGHCDDSEDSEFEIIDTREIANLTTS